jgi:type II secretory pathway pseudopilin PulG
MAIVGIIVAIAVPSYLGFRGRAADSAAMANIRATLHSAEAYFLDNGTYVGMTAGGLRADYDAGLASSLTISGTPSVSSYCLTDTVAGHAWSVLGPGATPSSFKNNSTCS